MKYPIFAVHDSADWCHLCGDRQSCTLDIFYPENAENQVEGEKPQKYLRACGWCLSRMCSFLDTSIIKKAEYFEQEFLCSTHLGSKLDECEC